MTAKTPSITARAIVPAPTAIEITIPINLLKQTRDELFAAYDQKSGPSPMLASLCDQVEEVMDSMAGVGRVGDGRAA